MMRLNMKLKQNITYKFLEKKYPVASGFINLVCKEGIDFQLYNVQLDFETGMRKITISDLKFMIVKKNC